jgi:hypothetical protein
MTTERETMSRKKISPSQLHERLSRDFRKTAGDLCLKCSIPMPAYLEPGESQGPNWRLTSGAECSSLCHTILEDLVAKYSAEYDITHAGKGAAR